MRNALFRKSMSWFVTGSLALGVMCGVGEVRGEGSEESDLITIIISEDALGAVCRAAKALPSIVQNILLRKIADQIAQKLPAAAKESSGLISKANITNVARSKGNLTFDVEVTVAGFKAANFTAAINVVIQKDGDMAPPAGSCYQINIRSPEAGFFSADLVATTETDMGNMTDNSKTAEEAIKKAFMDKLSSALAGEVSAALQRLEIAANDAVNQNKGNPLSVNSLIIKLQKTSKSSETGSGTQMGGTGTGMEQATGSDSSGDVPGDMPGNPGTATGSTPTGQGSGGNQEGAGSAPQDQSQCGYWQSMCSSLQVEAERSCEALQNQVAVCRQEYERHCNAS